MSQRELRRRLDRLEASRTAPATGNTTTLTAERDAIVARHCLAPEQIACVSDEQLEDRLRELSAGGDAPPWLLRLQAINAALGPGTGPLAHDAIEAAFAELAA